jgi:Methylamine utilisation protein MauE
MIGLGALMGTALSIVLLGAGIGKLGDRVAFRRALRSYGWLPELSVAPLSWLVPFLELGCAVGLWLPPIRQAAATLTIGLLIVFTAVIVRALAEGSQANCGCFGGSGADQVSWLGVGRNAVLLALAVVAALPVAGRYPPPVPSVLAGAGVGLIILLLDQALGVFPDHWLRPNDVWE